MKFLCDRCKTRYSIGDDRVRGKILKIRCKNCANVITVREGMEAGEEAGERRHPTTSVPAIQDSRPAGPLNAAFSAQLAKPPPALEEEWYVSIDGDQSGPFSLAEAQRWVAGKAFEADLHCWSEGFDDWLPVDKVSHFRGLRKKPEPPKAPPPLPRAAPPRPAAPASAAPRLRAPVDPVEEEEPKPLFAATMASLEKSASTTLPPVNATATPAKANGNASAPPIPAATKQPSGRVPAIPSVKATGQVPSVVSKAGSGPSRNGAGSLPTPATGKGTGPVRPATVQGMSPGAAALAAAFDSSEAGDSLTAVEVPPFNDELATAAEPAAATKRAFDRGADRADRAETKKPEPKPEPKKPAALSLDALAREDHGGVPEDDNLDIGEVSRVVNLKDLVRPPADARKPSRAPGAGQTGAVGRVTGPVGRVTGPVNRVTGAVTRMSPDEIGLSPGDPNAYLANPDAAAAESLVVPAPVAHSHRRGLIMLIGVSVVLLLGVIGAVVLMVTSSSDDVPMGLGHTSQINSDRPEDYGHPRNPGDTSAGPNAGPGKKPPTSHWPALRPQGPTSTQETEPTDPTLKKLGADEIEDMAAKQGEGTKFCYIRAQKGALGLEMLDLKKISVTLTVDKTGTVTDVQLSDHAKDTFGACLVTRIKGWKFRVSPGGTYRIALAFSNG